MGREVLHISGHTVLLSYMLVSSQSMIVRIASIVVLLQTMVPKYYVWGDFVTSNIGLVSGCALAFGGQMGFEERSRKRRTRK
jgi:hypothetical protein